MIFPIIWVETAKSYGKKSLTDTIFSVITLGFYLYKIDVIRDFPNCDMGIVKYWKGLDTIGFCGKYNVVPFDLNCGKIRSVDRPHHIQEVESKL